MDFGFYFLDRLAQTTREGYIVTSQLLASGGGAQAPPQCADSKAVMGASGFDN